MARKMLHGFNLPALVNPPVSFCDFPKPANSRSAAFAVGCVTHLVDCPCNENCEPSGAATRYAVDCPQAQASRFTSLSGPQCVTAKRVQTPADVPGFFLTGTSPAQAVKVATSSGGRASHLVAITGHAGSGRSSDGQQLAPGQDRHVWQQDRQP